MYVKMIHKYINQELSKNIQNANSYFYKKTTRNHGQPTSVISCRGLINRFCLSFSNFSSSSSRPSSNSCIARLTIWSLSRVLVAFCSVFMEISSEVWEWVRSNRRRTSSFSDCVVSDEDTCRIYLWLYRLSWHSQFRIVIHIQPHFQ